MALSREEVNRLLAEAAEANRGQVHQLVGSTRLSKAQVGELSMLDAGDRWYRARESDRELREIAVPLDDLNEPPAPT